jgi:hypothetical protein
LNFNKENNNKLSSRVMQLYRQSTYPIAYYDLTNPEVLNKIVAELETISASSI